MKSIKRTVFWAVAAVLMLAVLGHLTAHHTNTVTTVYRQEAPPAPARDRVCGTELRHPGRCLEVPAHAVLTSNRRLPR